MREIPLTRGLIAIVDDADYAELSKYKWHANESASGRVYARRRCPLRKKIVYMHRELMNAPKGFDVDHHNQKTLDNRRENLRIATRSQNKANMAPPRHNKTGYKGVRYNAAQKKNPYVATIRNGKQMHIGCFPDAKSAALAYDREALALYGDFACLNFPDIFLK